MHVRPARPDLDYPAIADVVNGTETTPVTIDTVRQWFEHRPDGRIAHRRVAANDRDEVIGYSVTVHETWWPEGRFYTWVGVNPPWRGRGMGLALYEDALAFLKEQCATCLHSDVRDDDAASLRFAERNGFTLERHLFTSQLDLKTFDDTPYNSLIEALGAEGIRFLSLADFNDSPEARRKLYEVNSTTALDIPGAVGTYMTFEEFEQRICGAGSYRPAGQLAALDGERWVGLAAVTLHPERQGAYNAMTGVIREYRGRKIALALKLLAIRYARKNGAEYINTDNDSLNAPMLAINRKLGYQPLPGKYGLLREL